MWIYVKGKKVIPLNRFPNKFNIISVITLSEIDPFPTIKPVMNGKGVRIDVLELPQFLRI